MTHRSSTWFRRMADCSMQSVRQRIELGGGRTRFTAFETHNAQSSSSSCIHISTSLLSDDFCMYGGVKMLAIETTFWCSRKKAICYLTPNIEQRFQQMLVCHVMAAALMFITLIESKFRYCNQIDYCSRSSSKHSRKYRYRVQITWKPLQFSVWMDAFEWFLSFNCVKSHNRLMQNFNCCLPMEWSFGRKTLYSWGSQQSPCWTWSFNEQHKMVLRCFIILEAIRCYLRNIHSVRITMIVMWEKNIGGGEFSRVINFDSVGGVCFCFSLSIVRVLHELDFNTLFDYDNFLLMFWCDIHIQM